jgi:hypothetical protein
MTSTTHRTTAVRTHHGHGAAKKEVISVSQTTLNKYVRVGLWALPIYGLANLVGTLSSQPDYHKDFPGYARYIHTPQFLASHLGASLLGTGIGLLGFTALCVYLITSSRKSGVPVAAFVSTILGNIYMVAVIGVAAFAQPAIGKAFLAGHHDVIGLNASVYGTSLNVAAGVGLGLFFAGAMLFAIAITRSGSLPRNAGILFAASVPMFAIGSITGNALAPAAALLQIGSAIWLARSASQTGPDPRSTTVTSDQHAPLRAALDA